MPKPTSSSKLQGSNLRQLDKFAESARELEGDEDEAAFKVTLGNVATAPRSPKMERPA
jgi:hypothetical protein